MDETEERLRTVEASLEGQRLMTESFLVCLLGHTARETADPAVFIRKVLGNVEADHARAREQAVREGEMETAIATAAGLRFRRLAGGLLANLAGGRQN